MRQPRWDIGPVVNSTLMSLRAELSSAKTNTITILIDPTLEDPMVESVELAKALDDGMVQRIALPSIHADFDPKHSLYLLHILDETKAEKLINQSVHIAFAESTGTFPEDYLGQSVCAWFLGEAEPNILARHISATARVYKPNGESWPLRFWDPRVLWHLPRALNAKKMNHIRSIAENWCFTNGQGQLKTANDLAPFKREQDYLPKPHTLRFDQTEWAALERISSINTVFKMGQEWGLQPSDKLAAKIDSLLLRCKQRGFETEQDGLVFAAAALTSHERFDEHPRVDATLRAGASSGALLNELIADFDDNFWASLSDGAWLQQNSLRTKGT
jgi:Domain of unknown function (DUF4123)